MGAGGVGARRGVVIDEAKRPRTAREGVDQELLDVNSACGFGCGSLVELPARCSGRVHQE